MQVLKLSKTCFTIRRHHVRIPQALKNDLAVIHIHRNFTLETTTTCIRKPWQLKNKHVINLPVPWGKGKYITHPLAPGEKPFVYIFV